ncbi:MULTISPECIES: hypothetical protein [unclassified Pseudonocardia]|uniref:hypothetical protein n=1 Tax=unclassified Pseudonocardia TaxID=2619320 RepID=UPI0006CB0394|nr:MULTISPECIES: hypothetical protein [unclassified Pseudonocardia]ALE74778.1 hypothetical protein FRP1_20835 [Pseudonocardia sp. EC080625-04]ALL74106.1 hypothetical protein AD006_00025 [Pseudonocardia sp. EC080610-09]ALL81129.1 hypothetical protein AD017_07850 [Pseudonocardia sp. EC080619-01]
MRGPKALLRPVGRGLRWVGLLPVRAYRSVVGWYRDRPRQATRVLGAGAVVLAVLAVLFTVLQVQNMRTDSARNEARAVAEEVVPRLLSYDHRSIADEIDERTQQVGGRFRDDYTSLVRDIVIPASDRDQLVTQTSTAAVGTTEVSSPGQVQLMMFLNQTSTRAGQDQPTLSGSRVRVTMEQDGDHWLVSALDPV